MRMAAGARTGLRWLLFLIPWPLFVITLWFMFHDPTIHGVLLNADAGGT